MIDNRPKLGVSTTKGSQTLATYAYTFAGDGQKTQVIEHKLADDNTTFSDTKINWTYDALNRLTSETYDQGNDGQNGEDYVATYTYDLAGNPVSKILDSADNSADETVTYAYNADDELTGEDSTINSHDAAYGYDANGSMTTKTQGGLTVHYFYDLQNHLVGVDNNGDGDVVDSGDITYGYDSEGDRVSKSVVGNGNTFSLIDAINPTGYQQVLEESATRGGSPTTTYLVGARVLGQADNSSTTTYLLADGHGSTRQLATASGTIAALYDYDAFGNAIGFNADNAATKSLYVGGPWDAGLQMYHFNARDYRASTGGFSSRDSLIFSAGDTADANLYLYAGGDPINRIDPSGMSSSIVETIGVQGITLAMVSLLGATALLSHQLAQPGSALALSMAYASAVDLISSGVRQLDDIGMKLMQDMAAYTKEIANAMAEAVAAGVNLCSSAPPKVFPVPQLLMPTIYTNTVGWLTLSPQFYILTYPGPNRAAAATRRRAALGARGSAGFLQSWDEFPYASTLEGGKGAYVAAVPAVENCVQGGLLGAFYRVIMGSGPGQFLVLPIP